MNKKGKILSIVAVMALVLSLVAVIPAAFAGAQTAGTVTFDETVYSVVQGFDVVTITVTDVDLDVARTGTVRYIISGGHGNGNAFDLTDIEDNAAGTVGEAVFEGETTATETLTVTAASVAGQLASIGPCTDADPSVCTLSDRLADADGDGVYENADVTYVSDTAVATAVDGAEITAHSPGDGDIVDGLSTVTVDFDAATIADETITLTYETYEYDVRVPGNTPIDSVGLSILSGVDFDNAINTNFPSGATSATGLITTIADVNFGGGDDSVVITFTYDVTDDVEDVTVSSETSSIGNDNRTIDLTETSAGSAGTFDQAMGLVTAAQLTAIETAADASGNNVIGNINNANDLLFEIDAVNADGVALALRLDNMLGDLGLVDTQAEQDLIDLLLAVSDGDALTATYSDADPSNDRVGTSTADLTPPTITLIGPADGLNVNPATLDPPDVITFDVQVTDTGAPINVQDDAGTTDLTIGNDTTITENKTDVVNGIRLTLAQGGAAAALGQGITLWNVVAIDAVGNSVADEPGGANDRFSVNIDSTDIASITAASSGFGANAAGTERTRSDNTGIEVRFNESIDGDSVAATDFDVVGSSIPLDARHFETLLNSETFSATGGQTQFNIAEFVALDNDADGNFADEYTVTVNGTSVTLVETNSDNNTAEVAATNANDVVVVTYTFDSSAFVYLTTDPRGTDVTSVVSLIGEVLDLAGNGAASGLLRTATDNVAPTLTVSLDAALAGDPDGDGDAEVTVTLLSSEILAADPTPLATITAVGGAHTGATSATVLTDANADFVNDGVANGDVVTNLTDGSTGTITGQTGTTITVTALAGGTDNDWDTSDLYSVSVAAGATNVGTLGTLTEITADLEWELTFTSTTTTTYDITATANDASPAANLGTADAVSFEADVAVPVLASFTPAAVATDATPNSSFQGLDDIARVVADFGESATLSSSTISGANLTSITIVLDNSAGDRGAGTADSGQSGTAVLTAKGAQTLVEISVTAGISGIQHIHSGTTDAIGGVIHGLGTIGEDGTSSTLVDASLATLMAGDLVINLHDAGNPGIYTASGNIPVAADVSGTTFADGNTYILAKVLAAGTYTWIIEVSDAAGNVSGGQTLVFAVEAPTAFTIAMEPGWNLISVPARLDSATPGSVFGDVDPSITKIRTWSTEAGWQVSNFVDGAWSGDILSLKPGAGYWVFSTNADDVDVVLRRLSGIPQAPRPQEVLEGWILFGPQFFNLPVLLVNAVDMDNYLTGVDWAVVYGFDPDPAVGFTRTAPVTNNTFVPGLGYWVFINEAGQIIF